MIGIDAVDYKIASAAIYELPKILDQQKLILGGLEEETLDFCELFDMCILDTLGKKEYKRLEPFRQRKIRSAMLKRLRELVRIQKDD